METASIIENILYISETFQTSSWTSLVLKIMHQAQAQAQLKMSQLGEAKPATKGVCLGVTRCALCPN